MSFTEIIFLIISMLSILSKKEIKQNYVLNQKNLKKLKNYLDFFSYPYGEKKILVIRNKPMILLKKHLM